MGGATLVAARGPAQVPRVHAEAKGMRGFLLSLVLALCATGAARAETPGMCGPPDGPVLLVLVESAAKVAPSAAGLSTTRRLVDTKDTVIYADGRAVTSDLAAISTHLNTLGWAHRQIEIAGAGTSTRLPPPSASKGKRRRG